jgi:transcriptional regulator with XRE-family HTH domain
MPSPFSARLRSHREARRITQAELARDAGLSPATIKAYERGARAPSAKALRAVIDALGLPLDEANDLLTLAGLTFAPHWQSNERPAAVIQAELESEADGCAWPAFVTNQSFDVLYANRGIERLMRVDLDQEYLGFGDRNLVIGAVTEPFASRIENWDEVMTFMIGLAKGDPRAQATAIDQPAPWLQPMIERLAEGEPSRVRRLLDLWESAPPLAHRLRYRYPIRWQYEPGVTIAFAGILAVADLATELHWNEWVPASEDDWRRFSANGGEGR